MAEESGLAFLQRSGIWIGLTREETEGITLMDGTLRDMRMRLSGPLHGQIAVTNCKSVRSKKPAGKAVGLSNCAAERGEIANFLVDHAFLATDRTIDCKGKIGKEARRG